MADAVLQLDLSRRAGWALYAPGLPAPRYGRLDMPSARTNGSNGPALLSLFEHIAWLDRQWPIGHIGYEGFLAPTGTATDDKKSFATNPRTLKALAGYMGVVALCAEMLGAELHEVNQASWFAYWCPGTKRGTTRQQRKILAKARAETIGLPVANDDEADALGQLHFLLFKMDIRPSWRVSATDLIELGKPGEPLNV